MKLKKIDKVDISLKQLIDVDSSTGITRCVDCIGNGMILMASVSKNVSVRDSFIFKNLSDIVKGTNGVLTSVTNGILTLSIDPNAISAETSLSELSDVAIAGLADNDYLVYNSVSKKWENSQASFVPTTRTITINGVIQDLSADRTWTISSGSGTVTSVTGTGTVSGLTLTGAVTTSGSLTLGGSLTLTSGNVTTALGFTPYNATNPAGYITSSALTNYVTNSSLTSTLAGYVTSGVFNSTISGLSSVYQPIFTTQNGLTYGSGFLKLGGQLTQNTTIDGKEGLYSLSLIEMSQLTLQASDLTDSTEINLTTTRMDIKTPLYSSKNIGDVLTLKDPNTGEVEFETPTGGGGGGLKYGIASGTNTYTVTITGVSSYTDGDTYVVKFTNGSDDDSTININSLGAKTLVKEFNVQLTGGDIASGQELIIIYDGTNFQTLGVAPNQLFAYVTNDDSVTINKGQPVYAFGASGNRMSVKLASNSSDATSAQTMGLVFSSSIAAGQKGFIITQGVISGVNTGSYSPGNILYVGSTAGTLTATKPYAPNHLVYIGTVERANAGNGQIYVKPQNGYELDEIHNVDLVSTPPVNNDVLVFDTSTNPDLWKPKSIPTILGYTPVTNARTISTTAPLSGGGDLTADRTLSISQATTSTNGYLSSTDWNTFNAKTSAGNLTYFGDGSTTGTTTISSTVQLSTDTFYENLTIASNGVLHLRGWRVFVSGTLDLTNAGANAIHNNGFAGTSSGGFGAGTNSSATTGKLGVGRTVAGGEDTSSNAADSAGKGGNGGNGGSATNGNGVAGTSSTTPTTGLYRIAGTAGAGGKGGNAAVGTGGAGGAGQTNAANNASGYIALIRNIGVYGIMTYGELANNTFTGSPTTQTIFPGLNGGGGGGGAASTGGGGGGGAGGGGGGFTFVYAKTISIGASTNAAAIAAIGGAGGNGANSGNANTGGGGGAGGGGGGYVFVLCNQITGGNYTFISAAGGAGGNGANGLGTGIGGQGGVGGSGGRITVIRISDGTITQVNGLTNAGTTPAIPTTATGSAGGAGGTCTYTA